MPLLHQAMRHLARKHSLGTDSDHLVGSTVVLPTADLRRLEIRGPEGLGAVFEGDRIAGRSSVRFSRTDKPGIYSVIGTDESGATHDRDEAFAFAVNLDPHGSDLTAAPAALLPAIGRRRGRRARRRGAAHRAVARAGGGAAAAAAR